MKVYVIIVNWNGREFLKKCLISLQKQSYLDFKIVVIDNGSKDGSIELVQKEFSEIKLILLNKNTGFGIANNIGIKFSLDKGAEAIALLNNDCETDPDWLFHMVQALLEYSTVGAIASQLLFKDDPKKINGMGIVMDEWGFSRDDYWGDHFDSSRTSHETLGISGGAALIRSDVLKRVGSFDTFYYMYFEDVDLSLRILQAGFKIMIIPKAIVFHQYSGTSRLYPHIKQYHIIKNHLYLISKFFPLHKSMLALSFLIPIRIIEGGFFLLEVKPRVMFFHYLGLCRGIIQIPFNFLFQQKFYYLDSNIWKKLSRRKSLVEIYSNVIHHRSRFIFNVNNFIADFVNKLQLMGHK